MHTATPHVTIRSERFCILHIVILVAGLAQPAAAAIIDYASYFGGSGEETIAGIATDANGFVYVGGSTTSPDLPGSGGLQPALNGGADFAFQYSRSTAGTANSIVAGDLDGNGDIEVVVGGTIVEILDEAGVAPQSFTVVDSLGAASQIESLALADVDGDGDVDIVVGVAGQANLYYANLGNLTFAEPGIAIGADADQTFAIAVADANGDGRADVVAGNLNEPNRLYLNNGTAAPFDGVIGIVIDARNDATRALAIADFDGDGRPDLVVGNDSQRSRLYLNGGGANAFAGVTPIDLTTDARATRAIVVADFDGSGRPDVLQGNFDQRNRLFLNNGTADPFAGISIVGAGIELDGTSGLVAADFDLDGDIDALATGPAGPMRLYLNDGGGRPFENRPGQRINAFASGPAAAADLFDEDGRLDLVHGGANFQRNFPPSDFFVAKLDPVTNTLLWRTYLGGNRDDELTDLAVAPTGEVVVAGNTRSDDLPLVNAQRAFPANGLSVPYAAKLSADGAGLVWATYFGGGDSGASFGGDNVAAVAVDAQGRAYLAGSAGWTDFPDTGPLAGHSCLTGATGMFFFDAFVARFAADGDLDYSLCLGGQARTRGIALALHPAGGVVVAGTTRAANFPLSGAPLTPITAIAPTAFVARLDGNGNLGYSTRFAGQDGAETPFGAAVAENGEIVVAGHTTSAIFPLVNAVDTAGPPDPNIDQVGEAFVVRIDAAGQSFVYATYLGGSESDPDDFLKAPELARGVVLDAAGNAIVVGTTNAADFPTRRALQWRRAGRPINGVPDFPEFDAFVSVLDPAGRLVFSSYLGGRGNDGYSFAPRVAGDTAGRIWIAMPSEASDLPLVAPFQGSVAGPQTLYVARIAPFLQPRSLIATADGDLAFVRGNAVEDRDDVHVVNAQNGASVSSRAPYGAEASAHRLVAARSPSGAAVAMLATKLDGTPEVAVIDAFSGALVRKTRYLDAGWAPIDLSGVNLGAGDDAVAVLATNEDGQVQVLTRRSASGQVVRSTAYFSSGGVGHALAAVPDRNANGAEELAVLATRSDGKHVVSMRDALDATSLQLMSVFDPSWSVRDLLIVPDINGNGAPEAAVLGVRGDGRPAVQIRDLATRAKLNTIGFFNDTWQPLAMIVVPNAGGGPAADIGVLATNANGTLTLQLRDALSREQVSLMNYLFASWIADSIVVLPDQNGNGAAEIAVLGLRAADGFSKIQIRDAASGAVVRNISID